MTKVRCPDRSVFPVNPETLEPLTVGYYDPYCFSDPEPDVTYIEYNDWLIRRHEQRERA